eukprot:342792-Amphidinium_carterae.1
MAPSAPKPKCHDSTYAPNMSGLSSNLCALIMIMMFHATTNDATISATQERQTLFTEISQARLCCDIFTERT